MCSGSRAQRPSISNSWRPTRAILGRRSSRRCAMCLAIAEASSCITNNLNLSGSQTLPRGCRSSRGGSTKIQRRLWDLLPIIRNHVYHPAFGGSYSLKSVLPALVPEMTYDGMEVADGQAAGLAWESLIGGDCDEAEREQKRKALLDYCGQDTLGMVQARRKTSACLRRDLAFATAFALLGNQRQHSRLESQPLALCFQKRSRIRNSRWFSNFGMMPSE